MKSTKVSFLRELVASVYEVEEEELLKRSQGGLDKHIEETDQAGSRGAVVITNVNGNMMYHSYREGKASGFVFALKRDGEFAVPVFDHSSTGVTGSEALWLAANEFGTWAEAEASGKIPSGWADVRIPLKKLRMAVRKLVEDDISGAEIKQEPAPEAPQEPVSVESPQEPPVDQTSAGDIAPAGS